MGSYRGRLDIIADMLRVVVDNGGVKKTQIMYGANLSYKLLEKYLGEVLGAGLLCFDGDGGCYVVTSKGERFLEEYDRFAMRNKMLEQKLSELDDRRKVLEKLALNE